MYSSLSSVPESSKCTSSLKYHSQHAVPKSLRKILNELNQSISNMVDAKKVNSMMTRLQVAKIKITPAIEQIVKTTIIYSEDEFKQKLRDHEPIFYLDRAELLRALEASRLLSEVKNALNLNIPSLEKLNTAITSYSIKSAQFETAVDKSIASPMKELIVNTVSLYPQSNKVCLDHDMIKRLVNLHENIIGTMDALQDTKLQKQIDPLLKSLETLKNMSSGEQTVPKKEKKRRSKVNLEFKNNVTNNLTSMKKLKKRKLIILPTKRKKLNDHREGQETIDSDNIIEEESLWLKGTRTSAEYNSLVDLQNNRTIYLDGGKIDNGIDNIGTIDKDKCGKSSNEIDNTKNDKADSYTKITSTAKIESIVTEIPKACADPIPTRKLPKIEQEQDIYIQNISEVKRKLQACLYKLTYIRYYLITLIENPEHFNNIILEEQNENDIQKMDANIRIPEGNVIYIDASTDTLDLGLNESEESHRVEFDHLLQTVLNQIDSMQNMATENNKNGRSKDVQSDIFIQPCPLHSESLIHDNIDKENGNSNKEHDTNFEHCDNLQNLENNITLHNTESCGVEKDICPPRLMHVKSVLSLLRSRELCHPNSNVKLHLQNIGLENLINSAEPAQCSKLAIVTGPRDLPEMPFKPSIYSLPLSQSDLVTIQNNVDRMKRLLEC